MNLLKKTKIIILFFLMHIVCAQNSNYYKDPNNAKIIIKLEEIKNNSNNIEYINFLNKILDSIPNSNIDLRLFIYFQKSNTYSTMQDVENYYRNFKNYESLANKTKDTLYQIRSKLMLANVYSKIDKLDSAYIIIKNLNPKTTSYMKNKDVRLYSEYLISGLHYSNFTDLKNDTKIWSEKILNLSQNIDTTNINYNRMYANLLINYADYVDKYDQLESFKYYSKANKFAHKVQNLYLINFTRLRISGCLINSKKANIVREGIDTLKLITKSNKDFNMSLIHYHNYIHAYKMLNIPDSVKVYQHLIDEMSNIDNLNTDLLKEKILTEDIVKKVDQEIENERNMHFIITLLLILSILLGLATAIFLVKKIFYK